MAFLQNLFNRVAVDVHLYYCRTIFVIFISLVLYIYHNISAIICVLFLFSFPGLQTSTNVGTEEFCLFSQIIFESFQLQKFL